MATNNRTVLGIDVEARDETTRVLKGIESSIIRFVGAISASLAAFQVAVFPIKAAADFQKELLDVAKTTDFTNAQIETLSKNLKEMSYRVNVAATDLAKIAAAGGQMGLGSEGVEGLTVFTEAAARFASVLDITAEEAGEGIARLSNIFRVNIKEAERIASLLNEISNNSTAKGDELIDMTQRIGTAGGVLGIKQATALAAVGRDLGLTVETVGTSFNKIFLDLQAKSAEIAPLIGLPVAQFSDMLRTDGIGALKAYLDMLARLPTEQRAALAEQLTGGGRIFALVTSLVKDAESGYALLNKQLKNAEVGFEGGTSAIKEQERVLTGLLAQLTILKNVFVGLAETVGRAALPYLTELSRQLQELGKDERVIAFFADGAKYIGSWAVAFVEVIKYVSEFSELIGPLVRLLEVFVALKIAGYLYSMTAALVANGRAAAATTKTWIGLLTANRETVQSIAKAAKEVQAANAQAAASGGTEAKVTPAASLALSIDKMLGSTWEKQKNLNDAVAEEQALTQRVADLQAGKLKTMADLDAKQRQIVLNQKQEADLAKQTALANGASVRDANAAARARSQQFNLALTNVRARRDAERESYNSAIRTEQSSLRSAKANSTAAASAVASLSATSVGLSKVAAGLSSIGSAVVSLGSRFLIMFGWIGAIIGAASFLLDMFGLLDPITSAVQRLLGITTQADVDRLKADRQRQTSLSEERKSLEELAKKYDVLREAQGKEVSGPTASADVIKADLKAQVAYLEAIGGKYATLNYEAADLSTTIGFNTEHVRLLGNQLDLARRKLSEMREARDGINLRGLLGGDATLAKQDSAIDQQQAKVTELARSYELLRNSITTYQSELQANAATTQQVAAEEIAQARLLAQSFDQGGMALLRTLTELRRKQDELKKASEDERRLSEATGSTKENQQYVVAVERTKQLTAEVKGLNAAFKDARESSSLASNLFLARLVPDQGAVSVDRLQKYIDMFSGIDASVKPTQNSLKVLENSISKVRAELDGLDKSRQTQIASSKLNKGFRDSSLLLSSLPKSMFDDEEKINSAIERRGNILRGQLNDMLAQKAALEQNLSVAQAVSDEYARNGRSSQTATQQNQQALEAIFKDTALKQYTDKQIAAQRQVVEAARYSAAEIKKRYEQAANDVADVFRAAAEEAQRLAYFFQARRSGLQVAQFDADTTRRAELLKKASDYMLDAERKRLEAAGLSTDEVNQQLEFLREAYEITERMRKSSDDAARQRLVLNDAKTQISNLADEARIAQEAARAEVKKGEDARRQGDNDTANAAFTTAAQKAEEARLAIETLNEKYKEYRAESSRPIVSQNRAFYVESDESVRSTTEAVVKARTEAQRMQAEILKKASEATQLSTQQEEARLVSLQQKSEQLQQGLSSLLSIAPELAKAQTAIGDAVLKQTEGYATVAESLQSISNSYLRGTDAVSLMASKREDFAAIEKSIANIAAQQATAVAGSLTDTKQAAEAVFNSLSISREAATRATEPLRYSVTQAIEEGAQGAAPNVAVGFPDAAKSLQENLDKGAFTAKVNVQPGAGGVRGYSTGGAVRGPGTGTSDSILARLSDGEFVMDAHTTGTFGSGFFEALQKFAHGGRSAILRSVGAMGGGYRLPGFAGGGMVDVKQLMASSPMAGPSGAGMETVQVVLDVGGAPHRLITSRDTARTLTKAFQNLGRSSNQ